LAKAKDSTKEHSTKGNKMRIQLDNKKGQDIPVRDHIFLLSTSTESVTYGANMSNGETIFIGLTRTDLENALKLMDDFKAKMTKHFEEVRTKAGNNG
jgi:hypothetical protein